jgi:hypothetical protein
MNFWAMWVGSTPTQRLRQYTISASHNSAAEVSSLLGCYAM